MNSSLSPQLKLRSGCGVLLTVFCLDLVCFGADWPQYRGPTHDGVSTDRINKQWTGSVTNPLWQVFLGNGITSFAVSGGLALTQVTRNVNGVPMDVCVALNTTNGTEVWATPVDNFVLYQDGGVGSTDDGPRSTPIVDDGSVYVLTSWHKLLRLNATNGSVVWSNWLAVTYPTTEWIRWQNAASPLVENGLIFLNANAPPLRLMALRTTDMSLVWRAQDEVMSHSTPVLTTIDGVRQVVFATVSNLVSLNPTNGDLLWKAPYPFRVGDTLAVSPVIHSNIVFITGYYSAASFATRVSLSNTTWVTTPLWTNSSLRSWWSTPVAYQGHLFCQFATDQYGELRCIELKTGVQKWAQPQFGRGSVLLVDNHLLAITERGDLVLAEPNTNAYTEMARFRAIPDFDTDTNKCWNAPAVCDGKVYVRSTAYAAAFDLSVPETPYLKLDPPWLSPGKLLGLTIRTTNGTPIASNRLTGMEVKTSADPAMPRALWTKLTNSLSLTNGIVSVTNVDASAPRRFFIVSEPK